MLSEEVFGYKVLPIKLSENSISCHWLYLKRHKVREKCAEKPVDRTLFILGIPPYATEDSLKRMFSCCGFVEAVYFHIKPTASSPNIEQSRFFAQHTKIKGFKVAYVVFKTEQGLEKAMDLDHRTPLVLSTDDAPIVCGVNKWCAEYNERITDSDALQKDIDSFMAEFDKKEEERLQGEKIASEPDESGWITVTKQGRRPGFARKESVSTKIMNKEKQKRSKKELLNFYRFQIKESKMNHLVSLRQKFEEDKKKIATLKQTRKFKPF